MSKYFMLLILVLTMPLVGLALPSQPNYSHPQVISQIPYFKNLQYTIGIYNQTTTSNTTKTVEIANYSINYNVISQNNGKLLVNVNLTPIHVPTNFSFNLIKSGNYTVNLEDDMLSLKYPYIYNGYLYSTTYQLIFPKISIYLSYLNQTKIDINEINYTAIEYQNFSATLASEEHFYVLSNGIGYSFNTTYTPNGSKYSYTVSFHLENLSIEQNSSLSNSYPQFISDAEKPYQYTLCEYSSLSNSLQPLTYVQAYYPLIFTNGYLAAEEIELSFLSGAPVNQNFGFSLVVGNYTSLPLTFTYSNSSQIIWGGNIFNKINTTTINVYNHNYLVNVYENITANKDITILYFSTNNGTLIKRAQGTINGNIENITTELLYTPKMISPNSTYINYAHTAVSGTLPYHVVSPSYSLIISIIVTLVIVAIIVLLYKR
uniref:Thermopsin n=2 Tax=Acidianus TaxID=12914 RepID=A0A2U9ILY8_9CREN